MAHIYNPGDSPVTIDGDGRILGGREHGEADSRREPIRGHLAAGRLVNLDQLKPAPADKGDS